ncbi:MAG: tRNA (guanosine(37)-N1)-methyltransferase TrmD [Acidimicrobiia bacterium]|nr:tRNA (guanosine(37)-N1)-methyltransferase TrmD [Acidimicrobiia bacterium]MBP8180202.1 tRNA (guanosine(37)-N1)-methyltransferase TrmD [Acidimicrobiia bacterium]
MSETDSRDPTAGLRVDVFSVFPDLVDRSLNDSVMGRARLSGLLDLRLHNPRDWATDRHKSVDDTPFGGGAGMVMSPQPLFDAVEAVDPARPLILLSASGTRFDQSMATELAAAGGFSLICGRYEGIDQRVADHLCDFEVSIGDFVLSGGEPAAVVIIDATTRMIDGVLGNDSSLTEESHSKRRLEYPQYTRPASFRGWDVPSVLLSGHHGNVRRWRLARALQRTMQRRPDLLDAEPATSEELAALGEFGDATA